MADCYDHEARFKSYRGQAKKAWTRFQERVKKHAYDRIAKQLEGNYHKAKGQANEEHAKAKKLGCSWIKSTKKL